MVSLYLFTFVSQMIALSTDYVAIIIAKKHKAYGSAVQVVVVTGKYYELTCSRLRTSHHQGNFF